MDLNIGTAFWFAARGKGYLYGCSAPSSCSLLEELLNHERRPLLRLGAFQAAQAVGLSELTPLQRKGVEKRSCSNTACGRYSKDKCVSALCGKCCKRSQIKLSNCCPVHRLVAFAHDDHLGGVPSLAKRQDEEVKKEEYISEARALLIGIGADEHLAGYGRHRTVFEKDGLEALQRELCIDQTRLWQRNLGRDDRCLADNGREAWYPYIDEEVISLLHSLNLLDLADLRLGQGEGDKKILRDASRLIGLNTCSALVKRAIQFGTKIAKVTNVVYHGSSRRGRGDEDISAKRLDDSS